MTDATLCQNYAFMLELCQLCFYAFMPKAMLASSGKANSCRRFLMHFFKYFFLKQRNIERPFERRSKIDRRSGRSNDVHNTISNVRPNLG